MLSWRPSQIVTAVQSIVSRNIVATDPCVITIGKFHAGSAGNVIADRAELAGHYAHDDAADEEKGDAAPERDGGRCGGAMGASASVKYRPGYIAQKNDDSVMDIVAETAAECIGEKNIIHERVSFHGSGRLCFLFQRDSVGILFRGNRLSEPEHYGIHHGNLKRMKARWIPPF